MQWMSLVLIVLLQLGPGTPSGADSVRGVATPVDSVAQIVLVPQPVIFAGDTIFYVYSHLGEFEAHERALQITERLRQLARNRQSLDSLRIVEHHGVTDVLLDTLRVFSVTADDAAAVEMAKDSAAQSYRTTIIDAVRSRRAEISFGAMIERIAISAGMLLALIGFFWGMQKLFPRLYAWLKKWEGTYFRTIQFRGHTLLDAASVTAAHVAILRGIRLVVSIGLIFGFFSIVFSLFPETQEWELRPLASSVAFTILATVVVIGLWRVGGVFFRRLSATINAWRGTVIRGVRLRNFEILSEEQIEGLVQGAATLVKYASVLLVAYFYLTIVFNFFEFSRTWARTLLDYVLDPVMTVIASFIAFLPDLFFIVVIVAVTRFLLRIVKGLFVEISRGRVTFAGFHRDWAMPTYQIVRFLTIAFAAIMIFPYLPGSDSPAFQGVSVFLGILFSLGSSSAIANMVSGVVITYMRPFQIGDRVKIADTIGDVVERNLLVTRVRTVKNVDVTIPNAMVLGSHIINYSSSAGEKGLILHTTVTIGYDAPWRTVHELLIQAAQDTKDILPEPVPFVLQKSLDDYSVAYELNAYTITANRMMAIYSELHQHIQDRFNQAGVEIMSPAYSAVRDGNQVTIPQEHLPAAYQAPSFRVSLLDTLRGVKPQVKPSDPDGS